MAVRIPPAAAKLCVKLLHCGQIRAVARAELLPSLRARPAAGHGLAIRPTAQRHRRAREHPELARDGIALRKFGQQVIERLAEERIHPSWIVPGGVNAPLDPAVRERILGGLPDAKAIAARTLEFFKGVVDGFQEEIANFGNAPTHVCGPGRRRRRPAAVRRRVALRRRRRRIVVPAMTERGLRSATSARRPAVFLSEGALLQAAAAIPQGIYRVGPLARLNVRRRIAERRKADAEFAEYHQRFGRVAQSSFHYHYARLIEIVYALERMETLLDDRAILDTHVRARAGVNALEGVGIIEAPRGILIHHYKVNEEGAIAWANLIVATGHNNLAINHSVDQVSRHFVDGASCRKGC